MIRTLLLAALLAAPAAAQTYHQVHLASSYDGVVTRSVVMEPAGYTGATPRPLLVTLHAMNADAWDGLRAWDDAANRRGWLLASPDMHGVNDPSGRYALAAPEAQYDVLDLIEYVRATWNVDGRRIYMVGTSMGGQTATVTAAKHPEHFAGVFSWGATTNMVDAFHEGLDHQRRTLWHEFGGTPAMRPWEYARRSPVHYARNMRVLNYLMGHGRYDIKVPPHHPLDLEELLLQFGAQNYGGLHVVVAPHAMPDALKDPVVEHLSGLRLDPTPPDRILLRTDEDQDFYYTEVVGVASGWRELTVTPEPPINACEIRVRNCARASVGTVAAGLDPQRTMALTLASDGPTTIVLRGLDPQNDYEVRHNGSPWGGAFWNAAAGELSIDVGSTPHPGLDFVVLP